MPLIYPFTKEHNINKLLQDQASQSTMEFLSFHIEHKSSVSEPSQQDRSRADQSLLAVYVLSVGMFLEKNYRLKN